MLIDERGKLKTFVPAPKSDESHQLLIWCAMLYLYLPVLVFSCYWILPIVSIPLNSLGLCSFYLLFKNREKVSTKNSWSSVLKVLPVISISLIWVSTSGIWGLGFGRSGDWRMAREDYLSSLYSLTWPITHQFYDEGPLYLFRHYLAFYIPGPFLAKTLGFGLDQVLLLTGVWILVGVVIVLMLVNNFVSASRPFKWIPILVFIMFSGLDILGSRIEGNVGLRPQSFLHAGHIEWWARQFQFSSATTLLHWVPQHAIAGWMGALIILNLRSSKSFIRITPILLSISLLWSPFVTAGIAMVAIVTWLPFANGTVRSINRADAIYLIFSLSSGYLMASYILSGSGQLSRSWLFQSKSYAMSGFEVKNGAVDTALNLIFFLALEIGPFMLLIFYLNRSRRQLIVGTSIGLIICTQIVMSHDSLFTMRASIPLLAVLAVLTAETLVRQLESHRISIRSILIIVVILIGSLTPIIEIVARIDSRDLSNRSLQQPCVITGCGSDMTNPDKLFFDWTDETPWFIRQP